MNNQQYTTRVKKISLSQNNNQPMNTQPVTQMQMPSITFMPQKGINKKRKSHSKDERKTLVMHLLIKIYQLRNMDIPSRDLSSLFKSYNLTKTFHYGLAYAKILIHDQKNHTFRWNNENPTPTDWKSFAEYTIKEVTEFDRRCQMETRSKRKLKNTEHTVKSTSEDKLDAIIAQLQTISKALGIA